jgi:tetratricopeptide (TPR) repeat protein/tRNA A-37 threonylcarbamoyl transferase component Bud32
MRNGPIRGLLLTKTGVPLAFGLADRYRIERELGRGGMATVYLARDLKHDRPVAVKVLHPEIARDIGTDRFLREIRLTARLQHPHILTLFDSGVDHDRFWYAMPYVRGESLRDRLRREVQLPLDAALDITRQVALALEHAHRQGVVHRDIKPANILLDDSQAYVADFGVATALAGDEEKLTSTGLAVGTPSYMSPEQGTGGPIDRRTDIYALGCVLYEMLAGEPPFTGSTPQAVIAKCIAGRLPSLRTVRPTIEPAMEEAILKALAPAPADRFAGAAQMADALAAASAPGGPENHAKLATSILGGRRLAITSALVALALGVGAAGYLTLRNAGVGSTPTLLSTGAFDRREPLVIADFTSHTPDSLLGLAATEAFRTDFTRSSVVIAVPPSQVARTLERMRRPAATRLDPSLAREVALRDGIKALVVGHVSAVAGSYVLTVQLLSAKSGEVLAAERETADATDFIEAIDRVSDRLRRKIGESLRAVRSERPLEAVTTASLDALRDYSLATRLGVGNGDFLGAIPLLEHAVTLDTGFAMAYRTLGVYRGQVGDRAGQIEGLTLAYQHSDRMTEREAALARAAYYDMVIQDDDKAIAAYRGILEQDSTDRTALINLALKYADRREYERAESLDARAIALDPGNWVPYLNLIYAQVANGKRGDAQHTLARALAKLPGLAAAEFTAITLAADAGDYDTAERLARAFQRQHGGEPRWGVMTRRRLTSLALVRGHLEQAEDHLSEAMAMTENGEDTAGYLDLAIVRATIDIDWRGRYDRGRLQIERALRKYPMRSLAPPDRPYLMLAYTYARLKQPARARELMAEYLNTVAEPLRVDQEIFYHSVLGEIALAERKPALALAEFRASERCPTCGIAGVGRAYDASGMVDSAIATYERYLATPEFGRFAEDGDELARVYRRLGDLYWQRGDRRNAREYYTRFVELWRSCDAELQPEVVKVRRRLGTLGPATTG